MREEGFDSKQCNVNKIKRECSKKESPIITKKKEEILIMGRANKGLYHWETATQGNVQVNYNIT